MAVLRPLKKGELSLKDMSTLREADSARVQSKKFNGVLRDYSLNHVVRMSWSDKNDKTFLPFKLIIDDDYYTLSWIELNNLDRNGFFRREMEERTYKLNKFDGSKFMLDVGLNDDAQRDTIVCFKVEDKEPYLDWYQFLQYGRFI